MKHTDLDDLESTNLLKACANALYEVTKTPVRVGVSKYPIDVLVGHVSESTLHAAFRELNWSVTHVRETPLAKVLVKCISQRDRWSSASDQHRVMKWLLTGPSHELHIARFQKLREALLNEGIEHPLITSIDANLKAMGYPDNIQGDDNDD